MIQKIFSAAIVLGLLAAWAPFGHAEESALDQLKRANDGRQDTGTTFDGSGKNTGKGPIDTPVQGNTTPPPPVTGQPVNTSTGTAGGYNVNTSSSTNTTPK